MHTYRNTATVALIVILTLPSTCGAAQTDSGGQLQPFLERNKQPLLLDGDGSRFEAGLLDVTGKEVFLFGEEHNVAINTDLDLALLKYLHRTAGVRVYLAEMNYSAGCMINRYFEDGDEKPLDFILRELHGTLAWTKEYRAFLVSLRQWNLTLPKTERVRFLGVDLEHQRRTALWFLSELLKSALVDRPISESIRPDLLPLSQWNVHATAVVDMPKLVASLREHRADYAALFGDRLFDFELVAGNLVRRDEIYESMDSGRFVALRDLAIHETFCKLHARMPGARFYGRWGNYHVAQHRARGTDWFGALLNRTDSPVAGKVVSLWALYQNSTRLAAEGYSYHVRPVADENALLKPFTAASSSQLTLFKLTGKDSPFERDLYRFEPAEGGVTTDYVQYFILIKDGQAAHPLKGQADADGVGAAPPVVVKTWPEAGSTDVSPDLGEIRVTFSKTMRDRSWSWCIADQGLFPIGQPRYDSDRRTCVLKVKLKPDTIYAMWLNRDEYKNFQDVAGNPSVPYLWVFKTAGDPPRSIAENIAAYIYDGNAAVLAHDYDSAIATFRKALSLANPKSSQAGEIRLRIGETYRQNGELDRSITTLQEARELAPDNVTLLCTLALALDGAGRVPEAQEAYEDVLRRDPDQGVALNNLAYLLSEHGGDLDKALAYAQRAQTLLPGRFEVSDTLGWIYLKKGQPAEAVPVFRDLVQKSPSPPTYRYHLAMALQKTGDPVSAARELKEALQHNPSKTEEHEIRELLQNLRQ